MSRVEPKPECTRLKSESNKIESKSMDSSLWTRVHGSPSPSLGDMILFGLQPEWAVFRDM